MVGRVRKWAFETQEKSLSDQDLESTDRLPTFTRFGPCDLGTQPRKDRSIASRQEAVSRESSSVFVRIWCVDPRPVIRRASAADPFSPPRDDPGADRGAEQIQDPPVCGMAPNTNTPRRSWLHIYAAKGYRCGCMACTRTPVDGQRSKLGELLSSSRGRGGWERETHIGAPDAPHQFVSRLASGLIDGASRGRTLRYTN